MPAFDKWISDATTETPVGKVALCALQLRLRNVIHFLPLAAHLADEDREYVHAARVGTRRASTALRVFRAFVPKRRRQAMQQTLKAIRSSMGEARDLDVYLKRFGNVTEPGAATLVKRLKRKRRAAQTPIIECAIPLLSEERLREQVGKLLKKSKNHAKRPVRLQPFGHWAVERLGNECDVLATSLPGCMPSAEELHEFRITTKRFRYAVELLSRGLPESARELLYPQVKLLQTKLGAIQDHVAASDHLAAWKLEATSAAEVAMLDRLEQQERDQYRYTSEAFVQWWRRDRIDQLHDAIAALRQAPETSAARGTC
jgi:CHAD domain-containing protein